MLVFTFFVYTKYVTQQNTLVFDLHFPGFMSCIVFVDYFFHFELFSLHQWLKWEKVYASESQMDLIYKHEEVFVWI